MQEWIRGFAVDRLGRDAMESAMERIGGRQERV
jgi:hypothetical protein